MCRRPCGSGIGAWRPCTRASCRTLKVGHKHQFGTISHRGYLIVSVLLSAHGYRGEWCYGPLGAAGGWLRWPGPEPPCGSLSSRPAPVPRSSWGTFANGSACPWSASHHEVSTFGLSLNRFGCLKSVSHPGHSGHTGLVKANCFVLFFCCLSDISPLIWGAFWVKQKSDWSSLKLTLISLKASRARLYLGHILPPALPELFSRYHHLSLVLPCHGSPPNATCSLHVCYLRTRSQVPSCN